MATGNFAFRRWMAGVLTPVLMAAAPSQPLNAASRDRGSAVFQERCASCHDPATARAPAKGDLMALSADEIEAALTTGAMSGMAFGMTATDIRAVAAYLSAPTRSPAAAGVSAPGPE